MKRPATILLLAFCLASLGLTNPPRIWLVWDHPDPSVWFNVYRQDVVLPQPAAVNIKGQPSYRVDQVTREWLTNGWTRIATVQTKYFQLPPDDSLDAIHCFSVAAVNNAGESAFATK